MKLKLNWFIYLLTQYLLVKYYMKIIKNLNMSLNTPALTFIMYKYIFIKRRWNMAYHVGFIS